MFVFFKKLRFKKIAEVAATRVEHMRDLLIRSALFFCFEKYWVSYLNIFHVHVKWMLDKIFLEYSASIKHSLIKIKQMQDHLPSAFDLSLIDIFLLEINV